MLENLYLTLARHYKNTKETRGKVGIRAGITESRLSTIVHGKSEATAEERAALARVLGIDEAYLFAQDRQPTASTATK